MCIIGTSHIATCMACYPQLSLGPHHGSFVAIIVPALVLQLPLVRWDSLLLMGHMCCASELSILKLR